MIFDIKAIKSYDQAVQPPYQLSFVLYNIHPLFLHYSMNRKEKNLSQFRYFKKKCNTDSKESFQNEVSEYLGPKTYLASKKKVVYRI